MRLSLYRTLSLRYLQQRWSRAVLVVASIALGVATLVATRALNLSMWSAAHVASRPLSGIADLHVSNGDAGVRRDLAADLIRVPGVRSVEPLVVEMVALPDLDNRMALLVGIEPATAARENPWGVKVSNSALPAYVTARLLGKKPALVGIELYRILPQQFRIVAAGRSHELTRIEPVEASGPAAALGGNVLYMDVAAASELVDRPGYVTRIDVTLEAGADREEVRGRLEQALKNVAEVRTPEASDQSVHDAMDGLQIGFSLCGAGALVVGLFLVYNALAVSVAERRHEIGILRSLGATRGQIWILFVGEATLLGLVGAVLGMPIGYLLANLGLGPMQKVFRDLFGTSEAREVILTTGTLVGASAAGVVTALLAALVPAVRASTEEPAHAVRRVPPPTGFRHLTLQVTISLALILAGAACMVLRPYLPARTGIYGCLILILLGLLLLIPLLAAILARMFRPVVRRFFGIEVRLAVENILRSPARTGLVITALSAGVALVLQTAGVIRSNEDVVLGWIDQSILADLFVTSVSPISGTGQNVPLKEELGEEMARIDPGISAVLPVRFRRVDFRDKRVFLIALDARAYARAGKSRSTNPDLDLYPRLAGAGTPKVLVSDNFAALYRVKEGDVISVRGRDGPVELQVAGVVVDYSWNLGTLIMDRARYKEHFNDPLVDVFDVFLKPDADREAARAAVRKNWEAQHALVVLTREEFRERIHGIITSLYDIAYAQEAVVGVVAALGVVTALLISVMQRRSEIGILRAIGATRAQVLRSVLAEATLMGLIGTIIGLLLGVPIEWYILQIILFEESGFRFAVSIPWVEAGVIACLALSIATLAGLGPALRTLQLRIPEAIAYE